MDERAAPAAASREALGEHARDAVEIRALERAERPGAAQPIIKRGFRPILRRHFRDDLLRDHVERPLGDDKAIELAAPHAVDQRDAFDEIVARQRNEAPLRRSADRVAGAADALEEGRDRARRADLADEIDVADVDAKCERGGRDQRFEFAAPEPLFGREPQLLRHAAVVRGDGLFAEPVGELARDAFGHATSVDEHQRRAVLHDKLRQARVDFSPHVVRHHRLERRSRKLEGEIAPALVAGVDDRDFGGGRAVCGGAGEEIGDRANRILRGGEADALQAVVAQGREPLQRQSEMGAPLVGRDGVDLVDDHRAGGLEHRTPGLGAEQDVERFRRGHEDVGRAAAHLLALGGRRVARSDPGPDLDIGKAEPAQLLADAGERRFEVAMDVVRQRFERRHVDDLRGVGELAVEALPREIVDRGEKSRERLARAGRRGDEGVASGLDRRPRFGLRRRRRGEALGEPVRDRRMEQGAYGRWRSRRGRAPARAGLSSQGWS